MHSTLDRFRSSAAARCSTSTDIIVTTLTMNVKNEIRLYPLIHRWVLIFDKKVFVRAIFWEHGQWWVCSESTFRDAFWLITMCSHRRADLSMSRTQLKALLWKENNKRKNVLSTVSRHSESYALSIPFSPQSALTMLVQCANQCGQS